MVVNKISGNVLRGGLMASCLLCVCLVAPVTANAAGMQDVDMAVRVKDYAHAVQLLKSLAEKGDAEAEYRLAGFYRMGTGVEKNHETAVSWLRSAALQDYVKAQYNLGVMYENGWGVPLDQIMAEQWRKLNCTRWRASRTFHLMNCSRRPARERKAKCLH
jgi:hypothetical protein